MDLATLPATGTCDLTTTGRRSGEARTVEIWYVVVDGGFFIVGSPGARNWLANLRSDPHATLHLREPDAVVDALAVEITDSDERRALTQRAWALQPWYSGLEFTVDEWVARSPMVRFINPNPDNTPSTGQLQAEITVES